MATSVLTTSVAADETPRVQPEAQTVDRDDDDSGPSLELLEFLGEWETDNGEWLDPTEIEDESVPPSVKTEDSADAP